MFKTKENGKGNKRRIRIATAVVSAVLVAALIVSAALGVFSGAVLDATAAAPAGTLTSVSEMANIPDTYRAVNVPAGTMLLDKNGNYYRSSNGVIAFDFHIMAQKFAATVHTCGNIAVNEFGGSVLGYNGAPEFSMSSAYYTEATKLSYINKLYAWNQSSNYDILVLGKDNSYEFVNNGSELKLKNPSTTLTNMPSKFNSIFFEDKNRTSPYIDITAALTEAEDYQRFYVDAMDKVKKASSYTPGSGYTAQLDLNGDGVSETVRVLTFNEVVSSDQNKNEINFSNFSEKTVIIDFVQGTKPENLWWDSNKPYHQALDIIDNTLYLYGTAGKRIIFNIDSTGIQKMPFHISTMSTDTIAGNSEQTVYVDNNIFYNFYQRTSGKIESYNNLLEIEGMLIGSVLAPHADLKNAAGINGSIIVDELGSQMETHKSDYKGEKLSVGSSKDITVTKTWYDNSASSRPDSITIKLYQNDSLFKTVTMNGDVHAKDSSGNDIENVWEYTFKNLPSRDSSGNFFRYRIEEVVPSGYYGSVMNFDITNISDKGYEAPKVGQITVTKKNTSGTILAGAQFKLTGKSGANLSAAVANNAQSFNASGNVITWTSTDNAVVISNLPFGEYTLTETGAPNGYKLDATPRTLTISANSTSASAEVINEAVAAGVKFIKADTEGNALPGATLALSSTSGADLSGVTVSSAAYNFTAGKIIWNSGSGEVTINSLPVGSYKITETNAPDGYAVAGDILFSVSADGTVSGLNGGRLVMTDTMLTGTLTLTKKDGTTNQPIAGVVFRLQKSDNGTDGWNDVGNQLTTDDNGVIRVNNLTYGKYYRFVEVSAKAGYAELNGSNKYSAVRQITNDSLDCSVEMFNARKTGSVTIFKKDAGSGHKALEGAQFVLYVSDGNTFALYNDGAVYTTGSDGKVKVSGLEWGKTYRFEEIKAPDGYTLPQSCSTDVAITENVLDKTIEVFNTQQSCSVTLSGTKKIEGRDILSTDNFEFTVTENGTQVTTGQAHGTGEITFAPINYTYGDAGKHTYIITENATNISGITNDTANCTVVVNVGLVNGVLKAQVESVKKGAEAANGIEFVNTYSVTGGTTSVSGTKFLENRALTDCQFAFELYRVNSDGTEQSVVGDKIRNDASGAITFTTDEISAIGIYTYKIKEYIPAAKGNYEYDDSVYIWTVIAEDKNSDGVLEFSSRVTKNNENAEIKFVNRYITQDETVVFHAKKLLKDSKKNIMQLGSRVFDFELYLVDGSSETLVGTYCNDASGQFTVPVSFTTDAESTASGRFLFPADAESKDYSFVLKEAVPEGVDAEHPTKNGVTYGFDEAEFTVRVTKVNGDLIISYPNGEGKPDNFEFVNEYAASGVASVTGEKQFTEEKTNAALAIETGKFGFLLLDENDKEISRAYCGTDGKFTLSTGTLTKAGTYNYKIVELLPEGVTEQNPKLNGITYDLSEYDWTVTATDNGSGVIETSSVIKKGAGIVANGTPTFKNTYSAAPITISFSGTKILSGRAFAEDDKFTFELWSADHNETANSYTINGTAPLATANCTIGEDKLQPASFQLENEITEAGTYSFIVKEQIPESIKGGLTYDSNEYGFTVVIKDNGIGNLVVDSTSDGSSRIENIGFINTYSATPAEISINGEKKLEYGTLTEARFSFDVLAADADGKLLTDEAAENNPINCSADGSIAIAKTFSKAGTYHYVIKERIPEETADISYDSTEYLWTVTVTDNGVGALNAEGKLTYIGETAARELEFTNAVISHDIILSKKAIGGGDELPGAVLTLKPVGRSVDISGVAAPNGGTNENGVITWTSGAEAAVIADVPNGIYEFSEMTAPDGYLKAETICIKVEGEKLYHNTRNTAEGWTEADNDTVVMHDDFTKVYISKVDLGAGNELPGATLIVTDAKGEKKAQWVSTTEKHYIEKLPAGDYTLTEITAPKGYTVAESMSFTVTADGAVTVGGKVVDENTVVMKDDITKLYISKVDLGAGNELPGATLNIYDTYGAKAAEWISTTEKHYIEKLPAGAYTLVETTAPYGYATAESIRFVIDKDGTVKIGGVAVDKNTVVMKDDITRVYISKVDLGAGNELPGATLSITDKSGAKVAEWISTEEKQLIEMIPAGEYTLTEITAPNGYEVAESMNFTVEANGTVTVNGKAVDANTVIMKDAPTELVLSKQAVGGGDELKGATLILKPVDSRTDLSGVALPESAEVKEGAIVWTSGDEPVTIGRIPLGEYSFSEITAPEGYEVAETIYIKVANDGIYSVQGREYTSVVEIDWGEPADENKVIMLDAEKIIPQTPKTGSFSFTKRNNLGKSAVNAEFVISQDAFIKTATSDEEGKVTFTEIPEGTYTLEESRAADGCEKTDNKVMVTVDGEGRVSFKDSENKIISVADIEKLMLNVIKPVEDHKTVIVNQVVSLFNELLQSNETLKTVKVKWVSSDPSIAEVDDEGNVVIKKPGKVTITASNGETVVGSFVLGASDSNEHLTMMGGGGSDYQTMANGGNSSQHITTVSNPATVPTTSHIIQVPSTSDNDTPKTNDKTFMIIGAVVALMSVSAVAAKVTCDKVRTKKETDAAEEA